MIKSIQYFKMVLFSLMTTSLICIAMEKDVTTRPIFSGQENVFKDMQEDIESGDFSFVFFDDYVFTNKKIAESLKNAKNGGAIIEGTIGKHWCNKDMEKFFSENGIDVQTIPQNHLKVFGMSEKDSNFGSPGKCVLYAGSANATYNAYRNIEAVMRTENDKQFYMEYFKQHKNMIENEDTDQLEKKVLEETPKKVNKCIGSYETSLLASKVARVQTLIDSTNEQRILYITSMSWNSPEMTEVLINAHLDGVTIYLILNYSALEGKGKEQLAQMNEIGIPIYIYYPGEYNRTLQHSKIMLRIDGSRYLLINSTANMTPEGDKENNADSYYTKEEESEKIGKTVKTYLDKLIEADFCKTYEQAAAELVERENKVKQTKKRLLFDDSEDTTRKKNKTMK